MHTRLMDKLRLHVAPEETVWSPDGGRWSDADGTRHLLIPIEGALTAETVVDAHVRSLGERVRLTIAHEGAPSAVAQRSAARLGIALVDARVFTEAVPVAPPMSPSPPVGPTPFPMPIPGLVAALERPLRSPSPPSASAFELLSGMDTPALPASAFIPHVHPALPWDPAEPVAEPVAADVEPMELLAMPWAAELEDTPELLPAGRSHGLATRPTLTPDWGLPWPKPRTPSMDAISKADPRIWRSRDRIQAVREDLDRAGVPSFGAVQPEGSAWLKRISSFERP